jgi:FlaA1/EpsC-like NDP-sugar epimerase
VDASATDALYMTNQVTKLAARFPCGLTLQLFYRRQQATVTMLSNQLIGSLRTSAHVNVGCKLVIATIVFRWFINMASSTHKMNSKLPRYPVLIIGAGASGIAAGIQLKRKLGYNQFKIVDRQSGIGGEDCDSTSVTAFVDIRQQVLGGSTDILV